LRVLAFNYHATNQRNLKRYAIAHANALNTLQIDDLVADKRCALA
jgi:hypothetical protein